MVYEHRPRQNPQSRSAFEGATDTPKAGMSSFQQAKTADIYYRAMLAKAKLKMITGETIDRKKQVSTRLISGGRSGICLLRSRRAMAL